MNFFGHAAVASQHGQEPRYVLGAMLPDLANMCRNQVQHVRDSDIMQGIRLHHATDDVFHAAPAFVQLCSDGVQVMEAKGLERTKARAVAHAGIELLLDGFLRTDTEAREAYVAALGVARTDAVIASVLWRKPLPGEAWRRLIELLQAANIPDGYADPAFVVRRLDNILSPRPQLALNHHDLQLTAWWVQSVQPSVRQAAAALMDEVRLALASAGPARNGSEQQAQADS